VTAKSVGWPFWGSSSLVFVGQNRELVTPPPQGSVDVAFSVYRIGTGDLVKNVPGIDIRTAARALLQFAVPADASLLAVTLGTTEIDLYDTQTWTKTASITDSIPGKPREIRLVSFSADGWFIAWNYGGNDVTIYDVGEHKIGRRIEAFPPACCNIVGRVSLNHDGSLVAVSSPNVASVRPGTLSFWNR
jgi:hypothetical protein